MSTGTTKCGKSWRCVCSDRKHPDGKKFLILIAKGNEEIAVATSDLTSPIKSQWFSELIFLDGEVTGDGL
jgi:hypothetical protein